jgi:putative oxidoreductase
MNDRTRSAMVLIRLLVGWVFLVEGIVKFLLPDELGVGRFASIGIPAPQAMAPFVGVVEIVCGALLLIGLFTRLATIPLLIDISVAIISTKLPIWLGHGFWRFTLPKLKHYGLLGMLHEARTDFSMLLGLIFLLIVGAGSWSLDAHFGSRMKRPQEIQRSSR